MNAGTLIGLTLGLPLLSFVVQMLGGRKLPRAGDWLATTLVTVSAGAAIWNLVLCLDHFEVWAPTWDFIRLGQQTQLRLGLMSTPANAVLAVLVTVVSCAVHIFSLGYLREDSDVANDAAGARDRLAVYYAYLGLFTAAMLTVVFAADALSFFAGWELMGFCSYQLIGFYRERPAAVAASLKAFLVTRVGDAAFLLGILALFVFTGRTDFGAFATLGNAGAGTLWGLPLLPVVAALFVTGTLAKAAQFPLQVWLPDAMQGPTPVSALIHAATMVAAGVLLLLRAYPLLLAGGALPAVALIGAASALLAAVLATGQVDLKKVLAYSTISQLSFMVLAVGSANPSAAFAHLVTHGFFKAELFLAAGAVLVATAHEGNLFRLGGLGRRLPVVFFATVPCALALCGVPLLSGGYSKELIVSHVVNLALGGDGFWIVVAIFALTTVLLTPVYTLRAWTLVFAGSPSVPAPSPVKKIEKSKSRRAVPASTNISHDSRAKTWSIALPLVALAILSLGFWYSGTLSGGTWFGGADALTEGWPHWLVHLYSLSSGIAPNISSGAASAAAPSVAVAHEMGRTEWIALAPLAVGICVGVYVARRALARRAAGEVPVPGAAFTTSLGMDTFYRAIASRAVVGGLARAAQVFDDRVIDAVLVDGWRRVALACRRVAGLFDDVVVDGLMIDGVGGALPASLGSALRSLQSGRVQNYFVWAVAVIVTLFALGGLL